MSDETPQIDAITNQITLIRGQRVMLDMDIARLYGVRTERVNEQVRRNAGRFPSDFAFVLTEEEWRSAMCPQIAGTLRRTRRLDNFPLAFTEHGCLMLSSVLRSPQAVEISVLEVRAFVQMRAALAANLELAARVDELGREVDRQGEKLVTHDQAILKLLAEIRRLTRFPEPTARPIGFTADIGS